MKRSHDSPSEKTENWEWLYGKLEPGVYRIGKSMIDDLRMGDARFKISSGNSRQFNYRDESVFS